ncbi:phage holin family protein, partial [Schleiferiaceae bacterium]|nr:phage holin family protein [Schleiferiaceae bacterium]
MKNTLWALLLTLVSFTTTAQVVQNGDFGLIPGIDYEVAGITVSGAQDLDPNVVIMLTNIRVGDNIQFPDPKISDAIRTLWRQQLFEKVNIPNMRQKPGLLSRLVVSSIAVFLADWILPGVSISSFSTAVGVAIILGLLNAT